VSTRAVTNLLEQESLFKAAASMSDECMVVCDSRREILYANAAAAAITGFPAEYLTGKSLSFLIAPKYRKRYVSQIALALRDKKRWSGRLILHGKSSAQIIVDGEFSMLQFRRDEPEMIVFVARRKDVSSSSHLKERSSEKAILPVLNSMPEAVCVADESGIILFCNVALPGMLALSEPQILDHPDPFSWMSKEDREKFFRAFRAARRGGPQSNVRVVWITGDDRKLSMNLSIAPLRTGSPPTRFVVVARDVSNMEFVQQLRRAEERLQIVSSDLQRKTATLNALLVIQRLVLENAHISKIFKEIIVGVQKIVQLELGGIYLLNADRTALHAEVLTKSSSFAKRVARFPLPSGEGLVGLAASTGMTMVVNNAHMDPRAVYPSGKRPACEHIIVVPLKVRSLIFGVLAVARNADPEFVEDDAFLVQSFADAATVALENDRLFSEFQKGNPASTADSRPLESIRNA
jgi:PAS domain S-box-containing protein